MITRLGAWAAPIGALAMWSGLSIAARRYPTDFDWRYMTVSTLLSPRDNPDGRSWAELGIALCGFGILCWTATLSRSSAPRGTGARRPPGIWPLRFGSVSMIGSGLLPLRLPVVPKGHELLTIIAFAGLSVGMVELTVHAVGRGGLPETGGDSSPARPYAAALAGMVVAPIVLAGLAQAYVFYARPDLHWVGLVWRTRGVPVYLSFAFWEWLTCLILSAHLTLLSLTTSP